MVSVCQWCRGRERETAEATGDFQGSETILYDTVMVDTCYYTVVKAHRLYDSKDEPNVN